jgi:GntR family transcriptional regulator
VSALQVRLDRGSRIPPYQQVVDQVREAVRLGRLSPGDQLPSVREVVQTSGINPNTVQKAYRELARVGLLQSRPGAGNYVADTVRQAHPAQIARLRVQLDRWLRAALAAGLELSDVEALISGGLLSVRAEEETAHG